jgi:hypothetical protein
MINGLTSILDSQLKLQQTKLKESSMEAWKRRKKEFMVQVLEKRELSLSMISICHKKRNTELNHQLNY